MNTRTLIAAAALITASGLLLAGPLNPPAGPVAPTYKTLTDVEPRTTINAANTPGDAQYEYIISQPGSYYFAGNLNISGSKHAVKIAADNVTLDFNGFAMVCTAASTGTAITTAGIARNNVRIMNGGIRGAFQGGIYLYGTAHRVEKMTVQNTFGDAIWMQAQSTVRDCVTTANSGYGILCGNESTVSGCSCDTNTMGGISTGLQSVIERCTANNSSGSVANGITAGNSSVVRDCTANFNHGNGIQTLYMCRVEGCCASYSTYNNFQIGDNGVIRSCVARQGSIGFDLGFGCIATECQADTCGMDGINGYGQVMIQSCRVQNCVRDGINTYGTSAIVNCEVDGNHGSGIHVTGSSARIEGNNAISNVIGFNASGTGVLLIRNSASASTTANYSIAAGNSAGPIVTSATIATNTNPSANFSY